MTRPPEVKTLVGYTVGKCVLQRVCGRGAMGTVYQGLHTGLDIDVAIKVLPPHLASNASLVQRFLREAKLAAKLNHANTVRVYDVGEESGYYYLVMEFVKGTDALDLIKTHGPLDAATVADIGTGAAKALAHAHLNGVVHRDIKPANLMLPETGGVKVADFGLARATASDSGLTMTGAIMGTPDYMAPEQAQGKQAGATADAYSLGGTLYHLFVGKPPYSASTPMAVALQHVTSRIVVPNERLKNAADRALAQIIHELTEKEPDSRLSDMNVLADRLSGIARMSRTTTQKLMSEGATLFATAGFRIDTRAIEKAKADAVAEMHAMAEADSPTTVPAAQLKRSLPNPMLDELRKVGAQVKSQSHVHVEGSPSGLTQDLADLTPEMVREAKAKARRSSGAIPALPPSDSDRASKSPSKRSSGHLPAITDDLPSAGSSRRQKVSQPAGVEDHGWEEYSAKAFPTFDRQETAGGQASKPADAIPAPWDQKKPSSGATRVDYDVPSERLPARKRSSGSGLGIVLVLLLVGGGAFAGWYYFLRNPKGKGQDGLNAITSVNLVGKDFRAHKDNTQVFAIGLQRDGKSLFSAGLDGFLHLWGEPYGKPVASYTNTSNAVQWIATSYEPSSSVAVATYQGSVLLLDASTLRGNEIFKAPGLTTLLWPKGGVIAGDSKGKLWKSDLNGFTVSKTGARITALAARGDELFVATAANEIVIYSLKGMTEKGLAETTRHTLTEGSVESMVASDKGVFVIVKGALRALASNGVTAPSIAVDGPSLTYTGDGGLLVVIARGAVSYVDPASFKVVGTLPLPDGSSITCLGPAPGVYGAAGGTASGRVIHWVHQP